MSELIKWNPDSIVKAIPDITPSKLEIKKATTALALQEGSFVAKYAFVKGLEEFCKNFISNYKDKTKEAILKEFNGSTTIDAYGVKIELKNYSKSNALKKDYTFSPSVQELQNKADKIQAELDATNKALRELKTYEIQTGIAKEIKWEFDQTEENPLDDFQLFVTLRKE